MSKSREGEWAERRGTAWNRLGIPALLSLHMQSLHQHPLAGCAVHHLGHLGDARRQQLGELLAPVRSHRPRRPDPMPPRFAIRVRLSHETAPGSVISLDQSFGPLGVVHLVVQRGGVLPRAVLEVLHPPEHLLDAPGHHCLDVLDGPRVGEGPRPGVDDEHLPVGLALVHEAHGSQDAALDDGPDAHRVAADVQDVQRVVVSRGTMELVDLLRVTVRLREAAVVEGYGPPEGPEPRGPHGVLHDPVVGLPWLHLVLVQRAERDLVDIVKESSVLVEPRPRVQVDVVPQRDVRRRRRGHPLAPRGAVSSPAALEPAAREGAEGARRNGHSEAHQRHREAAREEGAASFRPLTAKLVGLLRRRLLGCAIALRTVDDLGPGLRPRSGSPLHPEPHQQRHGVERQQRKAQRKCQRLCCVEHMVCRFHVKGNFDL
mmetsp:Transcript_61657/g.141055  ORF Transcript_61657/g.141055 Transcript_61657/m.141055 type:complete len:430 (-) Transcript_61657:52-1341(-)